MRPDGRGLQHSRRTSGDVTVNVLRGHDRSGVIYYVTGYPARIFRRFYWMSLRLSYLTYLSLTLIILGGTALLLNLGRRIDLRNPDDVVWMERVRRNSLEQVAPVRDRIEFPEEASAVIIVAANPDEGLAVVEVTEAERELALQVLGSARDHVLASSEWVDEIEKQTKPVARENRQLFDVKDYLWEITLEYIDVLNDIYSDARPVSFSEVLLIEDQLDMLAPELEYELARLDLEPKDNSLPISNR